MNQSNREFSKIFLLATVCISAGLVCASSDDKLIDKHISSLSRRNNPHKSHHNAEIHLEGPLSGGLQSLRSLLDRSIIFRSNGLKQTAELSYDNSTPPTYLNAGSASAGNTDVSEDFEQKPPTERDISVHHHDSGDDANFEKDTSKSRTIDLFDKPVNSRPLPHLSLGEKLGSQTSVTASEGYLSSNSVPLPDADDDKRMGSIQSVILPSTWGSPPFPMSYSASGPFTGDLSSSLGTVLTDDSDNGHRIRKQLLDAHNYVRQTEAPEATYMTKLVWDFHLEAYATQWATFLCTAGEKDYFEHSPDKNGFPAWPWRGGQGENLYTTTGVRDASYDFSEVVYKWYAEKSYYDWNTGKANPANKGPVGHYTQLVRQDASMMGCAVMTNCKQPGDWRTFVACQYDWGNAGKDPYVKRTSNSGVVCDACPKGFTCCEKNLCSGYFTSSEITPLQGATTFSDEWYGCKNQRMACADTGALTFNYAVPGDEYHLEFNTCQCGKGSSHADSYDTVAKGYVWYRDRCFKAEKSGGGSLVELKPTYGNDEVKGVSHRGVSLAGITRHSANELTSQMGNKKVHKEVYSLRDLTPKRSIDPTLQDTMYYDHHAAANIDHPYVYWASPGSHEEESDWYRGVEPPPSVGWRLHGSMPALESVGDTRQPMNLETPRSGSRAVEVTPPEYIPSPSKNETSLTDSVQLMLSLKKSRENEKLRRKSVETSKPQDTVESASDDRKEILPHFDTVLKENILINNKTFEEEAII